MLLRKKNALRISLIGSCALGLVIWAPGVEAQECQKDIAAINQQKSSIIASLQQSMKKTHGKLNPITACPNLRRLSAVESKFISYLVTNKDWCHVPDEALANVRAGHQHTASMAGKACTIAVQMQKMMKQQARQQADGAGSQQPMGPKLPSGPL